jgi:hypothetical protein
MDESLDLAGDFDLWARFFEHADLVSTNCPLAAWRRHQTNKSQSGSSYHAQALEVLARYRKRTIHNRALLWLAGAAVRLLGRGTRHIGSRVAWVDNDMKTDQWTYHAGYVL